MTGFEPRTSGIGSDRSTNWATTTAQSFAIFKGKVYSNLKLKIFWSKKTVSRFKQTIRRLHSHEQHLTHAAVVDEGCEVWKIG